MSDMQFEDVIQKSKIDFAFISQLEPQSEKTAYTHHRPDHSAVQAVDNINSSNTSSSVASGVTVGIGFDLGEHNSDDLREAGLNATLRGKLYPYLGLKGSAAAKYLADNPLMLSDAEVQAITLGNRARIITHLVLNYNEHSEVTFSDLPSEWQTVIASIACQYESINKKYPQFWLAVINQNWDLALNILQNFGDAFAARRRREAAYILKAQNPQ